MPSAARDRHLALVTGQPDSTSAASAKKRIIAVVGANAPTRGLVSAISVDPRSDFAARAIVDDAEVRSADGRLLSELGAEMRKGKPGDPASLRAAFAGAHGAFYIQLSSSHATVEAKQATAQAVASAAKDAGLRHVIWATLEDPGQALLEHDDLTPTFVAGRWISDDKQHESVEQIFARFGVPVTFLQISWDPSVAPGSWTEDIGRYAYTLLRSVEAIGKTVAISAARLLRGVTVGLPTEAGAEGVSPSPSQSPARAPASVGPAASARPPAPPASARPSMAPAAPQSPVPALPAAAVALPAAGRSPSRARTIGIAGAIVAGLLVGLLIARQVGRQMLGPSPAPPDGTRVAATTIPAPAAAPAAAAPSSAPAPAEAPAAPARAEDPAPPEAAGPAAADPTPIARGGARHFVAPKQHHAEPHRAVASAAVAAAPVPAAASAPAVPAAATEKPVPAPAVPPEAPHPVAVHPPSPAKPAAAAPVAPAPATATVAPVVPAVTAARPGYVDPKAVSAAVRAHAAEARGCYDRAIMEHPDLHGRLTLRATLDPSGHVVSLTPSSDIAEGGRLQSCLVAAFKSWSFPPPAGGVSGTITYAFAFDSETGH